MKMMIDDAHQILPPGKFKDRDTQIDEYCDRHGDCYCRVDPDWKIINAV